MMQTITNIAEMRGWSAAARRRGERIGFVPTMGYLHAGHLSLVRLARQHADKIVASIFVNPLQFGANEDLSKYPRDFERDSRLLAGEGVDALFFPNGDEMYPRGFQTAVTVESVTRGLCGASRPVHFRGVATVVTKLFNIVAPHVAVFGKKDYQQLVTIRRMVADLAMNIEIIGGDIVREADGLAMSSRNAYLSAAERSAAICLSRGLAAAEETARAGGEVAAIRAAAIGPIEREPLARIDYVEVVDPETMEVAADGGETVLLALAVFIGKTRLIDNRVIETTQRDSPSVTSRLRDSASVS